MSKFPHLVVGIAVTQIAVACAGAKRDAPVNAARPAATASVVAGSEPPAAEVRAVPPPKPCHILAAHNEEQLIAATERARVVMKTALPNALAEAATRLNAEITRRGEIEVPFGSLGHVKLKSLEERQLDLAARMSPGSDAGLYASLRTEREQLAAVQRAFTRHEPLPTNENDPIPTFCSEDALGAWGFRIERAHYVLADASEPTAFRIAAQVALVRVQLDGKTAAAKSWPNFFASTDGDARFRPASETNCCANNYGQGAPNVVLNHDQDGDGIPEIGLVASFGVEGSHEESAVLYRFRNGSVEEQPSDFDEVVDFDADQRPDLLFQKRVEIGEDCDSGFPIGLSSPRYLGHALPDGTYSLDDEVALRFSRELCPTVPANASLRTQENAFSVSDQIWCARLWGMDETALRRRVLDGCAKQACPRTSRPPCSHLESLLAGFHPPFRLTPR